MTWLKVRKYFPYIDRYKTTPGLENRSRSDISLYKNQEVVREITVLTTFFCREADIEYGMLKRLLQNVSNNRFVLAQVQP